MLIFISDLHFTDGTAGEHNVPTDAFKIFFEDISGTTNWLSKKGSQVEEIKLVFLGDIFDLLRTVKWLDPDIKESERPWGSNERMIQRHANAIFDQIIHKNQETFSLLKGTSMRKLKSKDLISISLLSEEEVVLILKESDAVKKGPRNTDDLQGKSLAMIFEKSSTRTRVSFETGI